MAQITIDIPKNDGQVDESYAKHIEVLAEDIKGQLKKSDQAYIWASQIWRAGDKFLALGKAFKQAGYHCALNYIPNGLQSLVVSKTPLGEPSGRLVTRRHL